MIFYLTFNDAPSGIFSSQVIDVVKFIRQNLNENIRLVSLVSIRNFNQTRKKIKSDLPDAIVIPMIPGVTRWRKNYLSLALLCLKYKPRLIIGRSVLATQLAIKLREQGKTAAVVYDGRGAIAAEWKEYNVIRKEGMLKEIDVLEKSAINDADSRIAVSDQLVEFWKNHYAYSANRHVVIPCTLNDVFEKPFPDQKQIDSKRTELGFNSTDIILAYSGSVAGWQSFKILNNFLNVVLKERNNIKVFFLSEKDPNISSLQEKFPGRITRQKVSPDEVPALLCLADYGLLIREKSITNKVASPVKFAEYLACGLKVIISEELGDYSDFVVRNDCGFLNNPVPELTTGNNREVLHELALNHFTKRIFINEYRQITMHNP